MTQHRSKILHRYPVNRLGRTFVVGDLHGCLYQLLWLWELVNFDEEVDILYITGDLSDRGEDSEGCIELLKKKCVRSTAGNHERLLMQAAGLIQNKYFNWRDYERSGGLWAIRMSAQRRLEYAKMVAELPVVIVVGEGKERFNILHAEFYGSDKDLDALEEVDELTDEQEDMLMWSRDMMVKGIVKPSVQKGLSRTFSGHNREPHVYQVGSQIMIDTGAYMTKFRPGTAFGLTMIEPATMQMWKYHDDGKPRQSGNAGNLVQRDI